MKLAKAASFPAKHKAKVSGGGLEYVTSGSGAPVIVLMNGGGMASQSWGAVYPQFEPFSTVFAYNRFGIGGSDRASGKQTGEVIAAALRELLAAAGLQPPYLLVGHSLGGFHANIFARLYPEEVAGIIFLEAAHQDDFEQLPLHQTLFSQLFEKIFTALNFILRKSPNSEMDCTKDAVSQIKQAGNFPDVPLTVITAGKSPPKLFMSAKALKIRQANQKKFLLFSKNAKQLIAEESGHFPQLSEPELVVAATQELISRINNEP